MGAIREFNEFNFSDFTNAIKKQLGNTFDAKVEENMQGLKSIFDEAAKNDGGEKDELYETYEGGKFDELVKKGTVFVLKTIVGNMGEKVKAALEKLFNKDRSDEKLPLTGKTGEDSNGTISDAERVRPRISSPGFMSANDVPHWELNFKPMPKQ